MPLDFIRYCSTILISVFSVTSLFDYRNKNKQKTTSHTYSKFSTLAAEQVHHPFL